MNTLILSPAGPMATITSRSPAIGQWAARHVSPWWTVAQHRAIDPAGGPQLEAVVVTRDAVAPVIENVLSHPNRSTEYAGDLLYYRRDDHEGTVTAAQPKRGLVYRYEQHARCMTIVGSDTVTVANASARLARELVRAQLHSAGWHLLRASAAVGDKDQAILALGPAEVGKTTTSLLLARAGRQLLAPNRVFARVQDGLVRLVPWPSTAAIGLGLLASLGAYDTVRERVLDGAQLPTAQPPAVTAALTSGSRAALWTETGTELKMRLFPDQIISWLGCHLAREGYAAQIVFPSIWPNAQQPTLGPAPHVEDRDFHTPGADRYPDVFGLLHLPATAAAEREDLCATLNTLPRHSAILTHDSAANTAALAQL
ncbi:hypothetical protein [Streptomyces sp. NPDC047315]|uniref:hypothetical protein n=1 Tax=Streptomyces sp. NPDC047315 TaxID=3155142 RepID=UPI0033E492BC